MHELKVNFDRFKTRPFPKSPEDVDLQDLFMELAELDGYIEGLASSRINGKAIKFDLINATSPIENLFKGAEASRNQPALSELRDYYRELKALADILARNS